MGMSPKKYHFDNGYVHLLKFGQHVFRPRIYTLGGGDLKESVDHVFFHQVMF